MNRHTLTALVGTSMVGLGMAVLATPAQADTTVTLSGSMSYNSSFVWEGGTFNPSVVTGTTVVIRVTATGFDRDNAEVLASGFLTTETGTPCQTYGDCLVPVDGTDVNLRIVESADNASVSLYLEESGLIDGTFTVTYSATSESADGDQPGPAPHIQQFGVPESGTCDEAQPEGLNWGGASSGGWGESWSQWINEGDGGAVCTRMLVYNTSTSAWEVD